MWKRKLFTIIGIHLSALFSLEEKKILSDQELIEALCRMDGLIVHEIYNRFQLKVIRIIKNEFGTEADGKDSFQEALIKMHGIMCGSNGKMQPGFSLAINFESFLITTAKLIWRNQRRLKVNKTEKLPQYDLPNDNDKRIIDQLDGEQKEKVSIIKRKFLELSEKCQETMSLYYFEGYDQAEIADILGLKTSKVVKNNLHRCREKLKGLI